MSLEAAFQSHRLIFKFDAGTSRGILKERNTYILKIWDKHYPEHIGRGEAGPLKGLSPDFYKVEKELAILCEAIKGCRQPETADELNGLVDKLTAPGLPSIRFALETALLDLGHGGRQVLFPGDFTEGRGSIPVNGLIWMGDFDFMKDQTDRKVAEGYSCIKMKIGALNFEQECWLLEYIRKRYGTEIILRVDANGAFSVGEVNRKLQKLAEYQLHSIEQPIVPGQFGAMAKLCRDPAVPVALDEELIGITETSQRVALLEQIMPQFLVLKPTLVGGLEATKQWIRLAEERNIGWWITSTLESNIGLNAIAQFTAILAPLVAQGLGTGKLYCNNIPPYNLYQSEGLLNYKP